MQKRAAEKLKLPSRHVATFVRPVWKRMQQGPCCCVVAQCTMKVDTNISRANVRKVHQVYEYRRATLTVSCIFCVQLLYSCYIV